MTHTCPHCKNLFQPRRLNQHYCRQSCRQSAYIKRKGYESGKRQNSTAANPLQGIDFAALLANMEHETLIQLLSGLIKNPSLTDNLPETAQEEVKNPSQNVSDGSRENLNKHGKFMEDSWKVHANAQHKSVQKSVNDTLPNGISEDFKPQNPPGDPFSNMLRQKLTLDIPPSGYVRNLFPHWNDKEWNLSLHVNQKMLQVFEQLRKASYNGEISYKMLCSSYVQINEFSNGLYAFMLPEDYPFTNFLRLLADRLKKLHDKVTDKTKIKFKIPVDLDDMMIVLKIQLEPV